MFKKVIKPEIKWVEIPGGTFLMGTPLTESYRREDEKPHEVTLSPFRMSMYAITYEQFDAFSNDIIYYQPTGNDWGRKMIPVVNINWYHANKYAAYMDCRLPTEAEWEYACRCGTPTPFTSGNCLPTEVATFNAAIEFGDCPIGETPKKPTEVGSLKPNAWGLYDMHGNVWEWCQDYYAEYPEIPVKNPRGPKDGFSRVVRGGGWRSRAEICRSSFRFHHNPLFRYYSIGFRVVQDYRRRFF